MIFEKFVRDDMTVVEALFTATFSASEGEQEGALVGRLARDLVSTSADSDLHGYVAVEEKQIIGAIFFSRLGYNNDKQVFILSPVAVQTGQQGKGIGQLLITHGLGEMRKIGVQYVITYGDPAFYTRVGFHPVAQEDIPPPHPLSQPQGWLGQSLGGASIDTLPGPCTCVPALDDPSYW